MLLVALLTSYTIQALISGLGSVRDSMVLMMHSVVLKSIDVVITVQTDENSVTMARMVILMMDVMIFVKSRKQEFVDLPMVIYSMISPIAVIVSREVLLVCVAEVISVGLFTTQVLILGLGNVQAPTVLLMTLVVLLKNDVVIV